jgi:WD40 repeat protein
MPDGNIISYDFHRVKKFENATGKERIVVLKETSGIMIQSMAFVRGKEIVATGTNDGMVSIWELDKRESAGARRAMNHIITLRAHGGAVSALAGSPDGKLLATASNDEIRIWNTETWAPWLIPFPASGRVIVSMNFSDDGKSLSVFQGSDTVVTYATDTWVQKSSKKFVVPKMPDLTSMYLEPGAISEDGQHIVTIRLYYPYWVQHAATEAIIWDGQSMEKERSLRTTDIIDVMRNRFENIVPNDAAISSSANLVALSFNQPAVYLYQINSSVRVGVMRDTPVHPPTMAFSRDGSVLAIANCPAPDIPWYASRIELWGF